MFFEILKNLTKIKKPDAVSIEIHANCIHASKRCSFDQKWLTNFKKLKIIQQNFKIWMQKFKISDAVSIEMHANEVC